MTNPKYIDVVYSSKNKPFTNYPSKLINYLIKKFCINSDSLILELGCGRGEFLNEFTNNKMKGYGIDLSDYAANFCKNSNVLSTRKIASEVLYAASSTITYLAPFRRACSAKVFPLKFSPFKQINKQSFLIDLVSVQTPEVSKNNW